VIREGNTSFSPQSLCEFESNVDWLTTLFRDNVVDLDLLLMVELPRSTIKIEIVGYHIGRLTDLGDFRSEGLFTTSKMGFHVLELATKKKEELRVAIGLHHLVELFKGCFGLVWCYKGCDILDEGSLWDASGVAF
jgi:hypothetical protein